MNNRIVIFSRFRKGIILLGIIMSVNLIMSCFEPANLNHPDDPFGDSYIVGTGYGCPQSAIVKINSTSAKLYWEWSNAADSLLKVHGDLVRIERHIKHNPQSSYRFDTTFQLIPSDIQESDSSSCPPSDTTKVVSWTDSTLTIENDYRYIVKIGNSAGLAKDSVIFDYSHVFTPPGTFAIEQIKSDTSVKCTWSNPDSQLIDSIRIKWIAGSTLYADTTLGASDTTILITNKSVEINQSTTVQFQYGLNSADSIIWQRTPFDTHYTMKFDPVDAPFAVCYQKDTVRITWKYDSTKVEPTSFNILSGEVPVGSVPNNLQSKIRIAGDRYFVFYYENSNPGTEFKVIPQTDYHNGDTVNVTVTNGINDQIGGFTYVDESYGAGFYISLYEMTIDRFVNIYNDNSQFLPYYRENVDTTRFDSLVIDNNGILSAKKSGNLPIEWLSWDFADTIAKTIGAFLPSDEEWRLAARAGSEDLRIYPWGDLSPNSSNCNFDSDGSVAVNAIENGRVDVYHYGDIKGPYHMAGNVKEWTSDPVTLRNFSGAHHARGGSWWDTNTSRLQIDDENCIYTTADKVGGIRLIKDF